MKKIYNAPLTEVVMINAEQMICQSGSFTLSTEKEYNSSTMTLADKEDNEYFDGNLW